MESFDQRWEMIYIFRVLLCLLEDKWKGGKKGSSLDGLSKSKLMASWTWVMVMKVGINGWILDIPRILRQQYLPML